MSQRLLCAAVACALALSACTDDGGEDGLEELTSQSPSRIAEPAEAASAEAREEIDVTTTPDEISPDAAQGRRDPTPLQAYSTSASSTIGVSVESCGGDPELRTLQETDDEVRIEVVSTTRTDGITWMCLDSIVVDLEQPLGDRRVIDLTTGRELPSMTSRSFPDDS